MKNKINFDFIVVGLALFAMFFGAGNLIFPPAIGLISGPSWLKSLLGFFLTGIGLPLMGIIALNKAGNLNNFSNKVSKKFSIIYTSLLVIAIGPLLAIPRTGATTFELGVLPLMPHANKYLVLVIYFAITLYFTIKPSKLIDNIGKLLTPAILILLAILIVKGIFSLDNPVTISTLKENGFSYGFLQGYQTMDALASVIFTSIILNALINKGYTDKKVQNRVLLLSSLVAAIGLLLVYGGLLYIGSRFSDILPHDMPMTTLIGVIAKTILGDSSNIILGLAVAFACLTTSIGLAATVGDYFSRVTKISYEKLVIGTCIFSTFIGGFGVSTIVKFSVPVLVILYPITIILIILHLIGVTDQKTFRYSVWISLGISLMQLGYTGLKIGIFGQILDSLPFNSHGFPWLVPFIIVVFFGYILKKEKI